MGSLSQGGASWGRQEKYQECSPEQVCSETQTSDVAQAPAVEKQKNGSDGELIQLVRTIEGEIIPRLMLTHKTLPVFTPATDTTTTNTSSPGISKDDVTVLAGFVLAYDSVSALSHIEEVCRRGISLEMVYLELLTSTARYLGDLWVEDLCDFTEVTIGLCCLHQVLRELSVSFQHESVREKRWATPDRRVLLSPAPGEQHTFGLIMVAEFFRKAGWEVYSDPAATAAAILDRVQQESFEILGLSVSGEVHVEPLKNLISAIRQHSCNRSIGILVGGHIFVEYPQLIKQVGADATGGDGREAVLQAENILTLQAIR